MRLEDNDALSTLFGHIIRQGPTYSCRKSKTDIEFSAGDVRTAFDDNLLQKTLEYAAAIIQLRELVIGRLASTPFARKELQNPLLHYCLACGLFEEEVGDLVLFSYDAKRLKMMRSRFGSCARCYLVCR